MYIQKGPYLQNPQKDSIVIMWETDVISSSEVRVYDACRPHVPTKQYSIIGEPIIYQGETAALHKVNISGLLPGHDYYYEVISVADGETISSTKFPFRTAPNEDTAISFALTAENGGSGGQDGPYMVPLIELIKREHPDFIMSVGDILNNGLRPLDWDTCLFGPFKNVLSTTPFYPCVSNHEIAKDAVLPLTGVNHYGLYEKYFSFPGYYSFDYGCAHFTVLDSPAFTKAIEHSESDSYIPELLDDLKNSEQYRFLEEDLASSKAKWKFVVFHYPVYCSSWYDVRELQVLTPLFEKYDVDIVFNSHAILYERSHPIKNNQLNKNGIRYILVGGYNGFEGWFWPKSNGFSAKMCSRPCYVRVSLTPFTLELQAIDYEGKLFDSLSLEKT